MTDCNGTSVDYDYRRNCHTLGGAAAAFTALLEGTIPSSMLDVGCGPGTWMRAALDNGVRDVYGIDGAVIPAAEMLVPSELVRQVDLTRLWSIGRRFDTVLCLEVAEHIDESSAEGLVRALTAHSDRVVFSAACPGQPGQHHVNCRWPDYWQRLFNHVGYACSDAVRWQIWDDERIEVWYRQNLFIASQCASAGSEDRIRAVVHPGMLPSMCRHAVASAGTARLKAIEDGAMPTRWYATASIRGLAAKAVRRLARRTASRLHAHSE